MMNLIIGLTILSLLLFSVIIKSNINTKKKITISIFFDEKNKPITYISFTSFKVKDENKLRMELAFDLLNIEKKLKTYEDEKK